MNKFTKLSICIFIILFLLLSCFAFFIKNKKNHNQTDNEKSFLVLNFKDNLKENNFNTIYNTILSIKQDRNNNFYPKLNSSIKIASPNYLITINDDLTFSYNNFNKDMVYLKVFLDTLHNSSISLSNSELDKTEEFFIYNFISNIIVKDFSSVINNSFLSKEYLSNNLSSINSNLNELQPYIKNNFGLLKLELSNETTLNKTKIKTFNLINKENRDTLLEIELNEKNKTFSINNLIFY